MSIPINVVHQKLLISSSMHCFVSGSQEFVRFQFNLGEEWDGLTAFAQFAQEGKAYNQYLDSENSVYLPAEIKAGKCTLMLYGSGDRTIATTNYLTLKIDQNILIADANSTEISESLYDQLVSKVDEYTAITEDLLKSLPAKLFRMKDKGLIFDCYSDGSMIPVGEDMPDESVMTFEDAVVGDDGDLLIHDTQLLQISLTDTPNGVGDGNKIMLLWSGDNSTSPESSDVYVRLPAPMQQEENIGLSISVDRERDIAFSITLYSCTNGRPLSSVSSELGKYKLPTLNDGKARHYRIPLTAFGINAASAFLETDDVVMKLEWEDQDFADEAGDVVYIDNIGFFKQISIPVFDANSGSYVIPIASRTELGAVKLGQTIIGSDDGVIDIDMESIYSNVFASDDEVQNMLDEVLGDTE